MKTLNIDLPRMYGDHHVTDVRTILSAISGVVEIYASSGFQVVEVTYDSAKVKPDAIRDALDEAGYLDDLRVPIEKGQVEDSGDGVRPFLRHSTTYETTSKVISFAQDVGTPQHALWPCPGLGVIKNMEASEHA